MSAKTYSFYVVVDLTEIFLIPPVNVLISVPFTKTSKSSQKILPIESSCYKHEFQHILCSTVLLSEIAILSARNVLMSL